jgi:hypothetical protein
LEFGGQAWLRATVVKPVFAASYHSQSSYPKLKQNDTKSGFIRYRNSGNQDWYHPWSAPSGVHPVTLATSVEINRASIFGATWGSGKNRPAARFSSVFESNGTTLSPNQNVVKPDK